MNVFVVGKIGSGKSTVAEMLSSFEGTNLIDADKIAREVLRMPDVQERLLEAFGELMLEDGAIVPESLAGKAFQDKESVEKLNAIMHPRILERIKADLKEGLVNIIDIPLPEIGREHILPDFIVKVECKDRTIAERCEYPEKLGRQRFISLPEEGDFTVDNSGSYEETQQQVESVWEKIR